MFTFINRNNRACCQRLQQQRPVRSHIMNDIKRKNDLFLDQKKKKRKEKQNSTKYKQTNKQAKINYIHNINNQESQLTNT